MELPTEWSRYFTPSAAARHLGLHCLGAGRQEGMSVPMRGRVLDCHAAVLIRSGTGHLAWSGGRRSHRVESPSLFWLFPGVAHTYAPHRPGWQEQWVLFSGFGVSSYEDLGFLRREHPLIDLDKTGIADDVRSIFDAIIDASAMPGPHADVTVGALVHRLITSVPRAGRPRAESDRATELTQQLLAEACSPLSMAEHARRLGVNVATLRESVRSVSSESPKELVLSSRLDHAKELLASTELPVQQIARSVGYEDPAYFSRLFATRVGVPPRTFRRQHVRRADGPGDNEPPDS